MKSRRRALSLLTPATYRILRTACLEKNGLFQRDLARTARASPAQTSRVVRWLMAHGHAERQGDGRYRVRGAAGLVVSVLPYQRVMHDALATTLRVRGAPENVVAKACGAGATACLETALETYSRFFRGDRVAVYHERPEELVSLFREDEGGLLPLAIYVPDLALEGDVEDVPDRPGWRATSRFRTVLDIACDGKVYAAKEVIEELWGAVIG